MASISTATNEGDASPDYRQQLHDILARDEVRPDERIRRILRLGADRYGVELGVLVSVDPTGETYTVQEMSGAHPDVTRGLTGDLLSTYCRMVFVEEEPLIIENAPEQGWAEHPAYQSSLFSTYIGASVTVDGKPYGTVCFVDLDPRDTPFDEEDRTFLARLAEGIGQVLEQGEGEETPQVGDGERTFAGVEGQCRTALRHTPIVLAKIDEDLRYEWVQDPQSNVDPDAVVGKRDDDLDSGPGVEQLMDLKRRVFERGEQIREEIVFGGTDGPQVCDVTATPLREGAGDEVTGVLTASLDVTEHTEKARKLEESEARYRALAENFPNGAVGVYDRELRYTLVEGTLVGDVLPSSDEFRGRRVQDVFPEATVRDIEPLFRVAVEDGVTGSVETEFGGRDWKVWATPLRDSDGTIFAGLSFAQDVTEQKRREAALREREARLRGLSNSIPGVVFQFFARPDGTYGNYFVSEHAEEVLGIPAEPEHFFERFLENVPESHREAFVASVEEAVEEKTSWEYETPYDKPSGERRWLLGRSVPTERDGEVVFNGVLLDITERKEKERRLDAVFNHTYQFTGLMEPDGTLIEANDTALEFGGLEEADVLGTPIWDAYWFRTDDAEEERLREAVRRAAAGEFVRYEVEVQGAEGTRTIDFSLRPIRDEQGEVILLVPEGRDITERKEAERRLERSERRFRKIFENAAVGIVIWDEDGRLLRANPAFEAMMGEEEEALRGRHFSEMTHPDDVEQDADRFEEVVEGRRDRYQIEKRYVRGDGEVFWGRLTISLLELEREERCVALVENIDDQKRYEEQLREAKNEAEEAARLKAVMLANMSHEVRTPLTSMIGFSGILKDRLEGRSAKIARLIHKSGRRLEETMEAVLQLSQLEAGSFEIDRETVDLNPLIGRMADEFELQARERGVELHVDPAADPVRAYVDETAVRLVVTNLLDNAFKFTPEGGRITMRTRPGDAETVTLEVEDTGIGIAEEALPGVFEAFKQESEGLTREFEGAGLGLSIVRGLVEALGGRIEVDTEKGEGTRMTIHLPRGGGEEDRET